MSDKKVFQVTKISKGSLSGPKQKKLKDMKFSNKNSYSAAKKAANAIFREANKNVKTTKFILENQTPNKKGKKKQLAYVATRNDEKTEVEIAGNKIMLKKPAIVKSCLKTDV